jgi:glycosyltransferase involved in cell wall biosynthesis
MLILFLLLLSTLLLVSVLFEIIIHETAVGWRYKIWLALGSIALVMLASGAALAFNTLFGFVFLFVTLYRVTNTMRLLKERMHEQYLRRVTSKSTYSLVLMQFIAVAGLWLVNIVSLTSAQQEVFVFVVCAGVLLSAVLFLFSTIYNVITSTITPLKALSDDELPTLTVAVAARNETLELTQCLGSITDNDYPKLEILVYDDCSHDRTAEIIKSFAHKGVRFINGEDFGDIWLAKNFAYQTLLENANGSYIFFIGTDVTIEKHVLRRVIEYMTQQKLSMISVLPKREKNGLLAMLIQPMRYWIELAVPNSVKRRPPALSTMWGADRKVLLKSGGFKALKRAIIPEENLAKLFEAKKAYDFVRHSIDLDVTTQKNFYSQWRTAVRTRYPQLHKNPEQVLMRTVWMSILLLSPFVVVLLSFFTDIATYALSASIGAIICLAVSHVVVNAVTNPSAAVASLINYPFVVLLDIYIAHVSMYKYEFGHVIWKGRNVCIPVMHTVPHLPQLDD